MQLSSSYSQRFAGLKVLVTALVALALATPPAMAQTAGQITIGGKVYGGGKEGAIRTDNTTNPGAANAKDVTLTSTDFTSAATQASQVTINSADDDANVHITAVFGGGEKGRAYGKTNVTINGGTIGINKDKDAASLAAYNALPAENKPVNGNAFGAGDGQGADVFGGTHVLVTAGTINGSVYGGGNQADLVGSTELTLQGGQYVGAVFGGAKQADIWGHTFVNVDGAHALHDLHIIDVYGGNDIAGDIKPAPEADYPNWTWAQQANLSLPTAFTLPSTGHLTKYPSGNVTSEWNAFVYASKGTTHKTLIDNIFGGGNGDYGETDADGVYTTGAYAGKNLKKPVIDRTYLQIEGGMYGSLYGGGNAATVAVSTDICLVNSTVASKDYLLPLGNLDNPDDLDHPTTPSLARFSADYQFNRVFGGNNKEPMAIRPNWYLEKGTINNLYSGGNAGPMTYFAQTSTGASTLAGNGGIILHVKSDLMEVNNVYGGCRMADVIPGNQKTTKGATLNPETFGTVTFQSNYAARVLIEGGKINNVYGGNDVSGEVYYGSQVEILSSINENVYGAGNGSYAYTDNPNLKGDKVYGDYYYEGESGPVTGLTSAQALSKHRPNAAQSYVHVAGTSTTPTYIGGAIYCGGNSATLRSQDGSLTDAKSELHIGSYVIADNVFLGSNGENMVKSALPTDLLQIYKNGPVGYSEASLGKYNSMNLIDSAQFEEYMRGVEVAIKPVVTFDAGYVSHSTKFGSLYCGGNVGSMSADGYFNLDFLKKLVIYNKLVGGCNNANVAKTDYNAFHLGGLTGAPDANNNKVLITVAGLQLEPRILTGNVKDGFSLTTWNKAPIAGVSPAKDMLIGGNIYGGCYSSGYINGGVNIDIQQNAISQNVFTESGVTYNDIRDYVLASTLACYGGGYGKETEIWGNVTVSITGDGQIMKAYGGGEMGVVGKLQRNDDGIFLHEKVQEWYSQTTMQTIGGYDTPVLEYKSKNHAVAKFITKDPSDPSSENGVFNTTVNLEANLLAEGKLNVAKLYAGGFQGTVSGNTIANVNKGRVYEAFGGASNADILGHTEMYVGKKSAPEITHNVYGANDFGGLIVKEKEYSVNNPNDAMENIKAQAYVEYSSGSITGSLFGGPCGAYEYGDAKYASAIGAEGFCKPQLLRDLITDMDMLVLGSGKGYAANSFVNIISQSTLTSDAIKGNIFGAGQGLKGRINLADERGSYVRLMSASKTQRSVAGVTSDRVYGAGYCSNTERSLIDAYNGYYNTLLGGAHGISYEELIEMGGYTTDGHYETNYMGSRSAVRLHDMVNNQMNIYGGGANAGAQETGVVLNGGEAHNVYGASLDQGITYAASVEIPTTSKSKVNAIFGGAKGLEDKYPCDVYNTFITYLGQDARVNDAIYGGNDAYRMTRNAYIRVNVPVLNYNGEFTNVFGGGFGENTVTLYTHIGLEPGAEVANVYGGGNNGQILDTPSFRYFLDDGKKACPDGYTKQAADKLKHYPGKDTDASIYGYQKYLLDNEVIGFHHWIVKSHWDGTTKDTNDTPQPIGSYKSNNYGHYVPLYFLSTQIPGKMHTNVYIEGNATKKAIVHENAYGGGLGAKALVSGKTQVKLNGGTVVGDIYGGGYGGDVKEYAHLIYPASTRHEETMSATNVYMGGGIARNVYGGGLNGEVVGSTNVTLGVKDSGQKYNFYGEQTGQYSDMVVKGDPIVERSLYGGGQNGAVKGTAYLTINEGHIGYKYEDGSTLRAKIAELTAIINNPATTDDDRTDAESEKAAAEAQLAAVDALAPADRYVENLDLNDPGDNFLDQNGNVFGAGYGEGASVDVTYVNMYGGTIRNSLYGGGEIAAVGRATMAQTGAHPQVETISVPGRTHIYMYNGLVQGDVFGGGRGYSYGLDGGEVLGKVLYTDGYVFGTTDVEIRGGTVGTPETLANGHGNVFGGGNIGYCFTDAVKKGKKGGTTADDTKYQGRYYTKEWECQNTACHNHEFMFTAPTVCSKCGKTTTATDVNFQTTFVEKNSTKDILSEDCRVVISPYAQVKPGQAITITGNGTTLPDGTELITKAFEAGDYVPTYYLDLIKDKNTAKTEYWDKLYDTGVTIRNAVFAGGNVSAGSDKVYANAYTVFGNATASVNDVFFRDFITLGTDHTGGLYGDGNLTFVDGYRELNITNYGTDYYGQQDKITKDVYDAMNDRERAYFMLEYQAKTSHAYTYYVCNVDHQYNGVTYSRGQHISTSDYEAITDDTEKSKWTSGQRSYDPANEHDRIKESEWKNMTAEEKLNWDEFGFCSIYAGRILNTIQRADFCGVFGSRLVLQGAQDRVPEVVDYTQYTINRVGEVSLNKKVFEGDKTGMSEDLKSHGNYFGLYNIVNYLGALTSDVDFDQARKTDNTSSSYRPNGELFTLDEYNTYYKTNLTADDYALLHENQKGKESFYQWKSNIPNDRRRNNGTCHNTVALAAGVYLELVNEPKTAIVNPDTPKDYGYITGVVQLDLINVIPGLGGGYVYAKNVHNARSGNSGQHENLSVYNASAVNNSAYVYTGADQFIETSGNFINSTKQIVDDCFPTGGNHDAPAHYWYIRGEIYVYDQYISAFTGSSTAYTENVNLPLTITAGANGRLDLIDIKQNYYAYYKEGNTKLGAGETIVMNNITYGLNDIITWWEYMQLSEDQQKHFVPETYVCMKDYCTGDTFDSEGEPTGITKAGAVILPEDYNKIVTEGTMIFDPEDITKDKDTGTPHMNKITLASVFHTSNAVSHENGYVLGVSLDNPGDWDNWYSPASGPKKISQAEYKKPETEKSNYLMGPTYYTEDGGVYGQYAHIVDDIITKSVVDAYPYSSYSDTQFSQLATEGKKQAKVSAAYVAVTAADYDYNGQHKNMQAGVGISAEEYAALSPENKAKFSRAYTCTQTYDVDAASGEYIYYGVLIPATQYQQFVNDYATEYKKDNTSATDAEARAAAEDYMNDYFEQAYIVTEDGLYGGQQFAADHNYDALKTWATLSAEDRAKFKFRYDALDALLLPNYPGTGQEGPGYSTASGNDIALYDGPYWTGTDPDTDPQHKVYGAKQPIDYTATYNGTTVNTYLTPGRVYTREEYENLPNERRHYSAFTVAALPSGETTYPAYYIVREAFVLGGSNYKAGSVLTPEVYGSLGDRQDKVQTFTPTSPGTYYICREKYTIGEKGEGQSVTDIRPSGTTYSSGEVPSGVIINADNYNQLVNMQLQGFTIHGNSPIETSTFIVNRQSDINDLSKDRVVTVVYQYKYEESDEHGQVEEIIERHVLNIHITFKSGVPTIGPLQEPSIVLPGQTVGLKEPGVTPGAYEILGGGWEYFTNAEDAQKHQNGLPYIKGRTPMYWYQDGYYVAYYAKTYLGKTYSNAVQFKVANYHDISEVMADTENYMFIDNPNVKRNSKIYIDNSINEKYTAKYPGEKKSEIDMLYDLFDKSVEKDANLKTIYVDVQVKDGGGHDLYYQLDDAGNPKKDVDGEGNPLYTQTEPTPFPVTKKEPQQVQTINAHTRNLANLDFFLNEDVATQKATWTPIGNETEGCFMGTLHGMGNTISGLDHSLFENLCGYVYNLGVTGSFTKSGVADRVSEGTVPDTDPEVKVYGHVNSSWIYTSAEPEDVARDTRDVIPNPDDPDGNIVRLYYPVVGTPNDLNAGFVDGPYDPIKALTGMHTLNCYYPEGSGYPASSTPNETANSATLRQFNNGEVAYDLNGFYLNKRYSDNALSADEKAAITGHTTPATGDAAIYKYWKQTSDGSLETTPTYGYYKNGGSMHAYDGQNLGYVERLFADGDFVYKYGTIPLKINERYSITESRYLSVWPDDYYFFGQQLSYGYDEVNRPYQPLPAHVRKTISKDGSGKDNRLLTTEQNNIIYRLPAYFRSSEKKWAHLNPYAVFADKMEKSYHLSAADVARGLTENVLDGREIHPGLTAIDFTGHNDFTIWTKAHKFYGAINTDPKLVYSNGSRNITELVTTRNAATGEDFSPLNDGAYFGPITDYTTIMSFETHDITQNLLTYAPTTTYSTGTAHTLQVLQDYYNEPEYATYYDKVKTGYRTVDVLDESRISSIRGHLIQKENSSDLSRHYYYAASDHFLVDKQDFNAPFEYEFNPPKGVSAADYNYRMWYQRTPDNYADKAKGWEGVCLPFSAELVTTQQKGEITHFYNSALGAAYTAGKTSGHEYWLREFTGVQDVAKTDPDRTVTTALMNYPVELSSDDAYELYGDDRAKTVASTFLWDYYYNADGKDANNDDYRHEYDSESAGNEQDLTRYYYGQQRKYDNYPLSVAGRPYIVGFPGYYTDSKGDKVARYYEFDLSGTFVPQNSGATTPAKLNPQTITFVSDTGITIHVSDDELATEGIGTVTRGDYAFYGNYLNVEAAPTLYADAAEYNTAKSATLTDEQFNALSFEEKKRDDATFNFYVLNADGSAFDATTEPKTPIAAFRPYFASETARLKAPAARSIVFGMGGDTQFEPDEETIDAAASEHGLRIYAKKRTIVVESTLEAPRQVRITTAAGQVITTFTINPGERVTTPVSEGVYITNLKKLIVD